MKTKKINPELSIRAEFWQQIMEHARREYPLECCGILGGKKGEIQKVYPVKNARQSPLAYQADPEEQFRALQDIEASGWEIVAIYHSHPASAPYPSPRDVDQAFYPEALYLIVSLQDPKNPKFGVFSIQDGEIIEREIHIGSPNILGKTLPRFNNNN